MLAWVISQQKLLRYQWEGGCGAAVIAGTGAGGGHANGAACGSMHS